MQRAYRHLLRLGRAGPMALVKAKAKAASYAASRTETSHASSPGFPAPTASDASANAHGRAAELR